MTSNPIKWHGGKGPIANWIIGHMPPRAKNPNKPDDDDPGWLHYVEPYAGGLSVLLANDPEGISEVVNDINFALSNFWSVLQDDKAFADFQRKVEAVPFSQGEYEGSHQPYLPTWDKTGGMCSHAVNFFIHCRQSMSGRMNSFAPITRNRTRTGMNEQASAWLSAIEGLPAVHARLMRVVILCGDALKVIRQQDGKRTLFYLDPPYLCETRTAKDVYDHEMTADQHGELLALLATVKGRFILSGYRSEMYDAAARRNGWRLSERDVDNKSGKGAKKQRRVECLWTNF